MTTPTDPALVAQIHQVEQDLLQAGYARTTQIIDSQERRGFADEHRQNRNTQFILDNDNRNTQFINDNVIRGSERNNDNNNRNTQFILDNDNRNALYTNDNIHREGVRNFGAIERNGGDNLVATHATAGVLGIQAEKLANENATWVYRTHKEIGDNAKDAARDFCDVKHEVNQASCEIQRQNAEINGSTSTKLAEQFGLIQMQAATLAAKLELQASQIAAKSTEQSALIQLQASNIAAKAYEQGASTQLQASSFAAKALETAATLQLQAANNTSAIQIEALKNKSEMMNKMEECCCELKERISSSEASIQSTLKASETAGLRDQLQQAQTQNLLSKAGHGGHGHGGHGGYGHGDGPYGPYGPYGAYGAYGAYAHGHGHRGGDHGGRSRSRSRN